MKHWSIDYSIKYTDGSVRELKEQVEAKNIGRALALAIKCIKKPLLLRRDVADVVIWDVGICEVDVF